MERVSYLDSVFGALRTFGAQRKASESWVQCAQRTENLAWKMTFLGSARAALEVARQTLAEVSNQLGPAPTPLPDADLDSLPPLTVLSRRLIALRADLDADERKLDALEAASASTEGSRWTA